MNGTQADRKARVLSMLDAGRSYADIARKVGLSYSSVAAIAHRNGRAARDVRGEQSKKDRLLRMIDNHLPLSEAARVVGLPIEKARTILRNRDAASMERAAVQVGTDQLSAPEKIKATKAVVSPAVASPASALEIATLRGHCHDFQPTAAPDEYSPCDAMPGSPERIATVAARVAAGLPIWHPLDRRYADDPDAGRERVPSRQFAASIGPALPSVPSRVRRGGRDG